VVCLTLFLYAAITCLVEKKTTINAFFYLGIIIFTIIVSNCFWLLPYKQALPALVQPDNNPASLTSENSLKIAVQSASIINLFLGRGENQLFLLKNPAFLRKK